MDFRTESSNESDRGHADHHRKKTEPIECGQLCIFGKSLTAINQVVGKLKIKEKYIQRKLNLCHKQNLHSHNDKWAG